MALDTLTGKRVIASAALDEPTIALLGKYVPMYGRVSAFHLSDMSHVPNGPWHSAWNHKGNINPGMRISNDAIRRFYKHITTHSGSVETTISKECS